MVETIVSICAFEMISGGDSAMMSPVVRIRAPRSIGLQERRERPLGRLAGDRLQLDRADQADVADVDDVRRALQRMQRLLPRCARARPPRVSSPSSL